MSKKVFTKLSNNDRVIWLTLDVCQSVDFLMRFKGVVKSSSFLHFFFQEEHEQQAASLSSELQETKTT